MFKLTTETPRQNRSKLRQTSVKVKLFKQKAKKFYLHRNYFTIRHSLYNNLISKSKSHLKFTVTLSFYVLFLGLIFRNYLVSPKLNHGFSGENTPFLKISYIYI